MNRALIGLMLMVIIPAFSLSWNGSPGELYPQFALTTAGISSTGGVMSIVDGIYAMYANPAGLDLNSESGVIATYSHPFGSMGGSTIASVGLSSQMKVMYGSFGSIGFNAIYHSSGKMAGYEEDSEYTEDFRVTSTMVGFCWSKGLGGDIEFDVPPTSYIGFRMNIYTMKVSYLSDSGFGIDAGYIRVLPRTRIGFFIKNLSSPNIKLKEISDTEPAKFSGGLSVNPLSNLWISGEILIDIDGQYSGALGGDFRVGSDTFFISAGGGFDTDSNQPTIGVGVGVDSIELNTAFMFHKHLGLTTVADLIYYF